MITLTLDFTSKVPLYEQIYRNLQDKILSGSLSQGEKLPSRRVFADHLRISKNTIENAYTQLLAEGYIESRPKSGYYVSFLPPAGPAVTRENPIAIEMPETQPTQVTENTIEYDLKTNIVDSTRFPFSVWTRLMHSSIGTGSARLLASIHHQGSAELRTQIANHLGSFRGMVVQPDSIILGAGIEVLTGLIASLLPDIAFAYENPGYLRFSQVLANRGRTVIPLSIDAAGLSVEVLTKSDAQAVFTTPSGQFPLGVTMSAARRRELLVWASDHNRYLIEDDTGGEYSYLRRPIPTLYSLDTERRVIYLNSFTRTLAPSLRLAYMVLPQALLMQFHKNLSFYSSTVSIFEQLTLAQFMKDGYYERHLNRMRLAYRNKRDSFLGGLQQNPLLVLQGQQGGIHLMIRHPQLREDELVSMAEKAGIRVYPLSQYASTALEDSHSVIAGYAGIQAELLYTIGTTLAKIWS